MSYKTNARMTVPLVGGGSLTFAKRDLISFAKYEGDNAILLHKYKKPVKIIEAQVGSILKETDIVRYQDIYGRVK